MAYRNIERKYKGSATEHTGKKKYEINDPDSDREKVNMRGDRLINLTYLLFSDVSRSARYAFLFVWRIKSM